MAYNRKVVCNGCTRIIEEGSSEPKSVIYITCEDCQVKVALATEAAEELVVEEPAQRARWVTRNCIMCGMTCDDKDGKPIEFDWDDPAVRRMTFQCHGCMALTNSLFQIALHAPLDAR